MINITLPDGSQRPFEHPVSVAEVAASIGPGLAKAALAGKVDGKLVDTSFRIEHDATLEIVTEKHPDALEILRHSTAHLLAQAVQRLFPGAQVTIGPVIENGFYYDFAYERQFTRRRPGRRSKRRWQKIVKEALPISRSVKSRDDAVAFFKGMGEHYKAEIIESIPADGRPFAVFAGRVHRPVPRPARAEHRQTARLQADEGRRRLLARRFQQRRCSAASTALPG